MAKSTSSSSSFLARVSAVSGSTDGVLAVGQHWIEASGIWPGRSGVSGAGLDLCALPQSCTSEGWLVLDPIARSLDSI